MNATEPSRFTYIDLFAGIGGFAAALESFGGSGVYSVEIDKDAAAVYERNWGHSPLGDITTDANDTTMAVPPHDILAAGFPCQPFSKSGAQRGMDETRGTLFFNIMKIIEAHHPTVVVLENVRNLAGPRHRHEWEVIIDLLRAEGYRVSAVPAVFSPHLLPLERGGRPQVRERVFITATYDPDHVMDHETVTPPLVHKDARGEEDWDLAQDLPLEESVEDPQYALGPDEVRWIDAWDEFVRLIWSAETRRAGSRTAPKLPGFPIWADHWVHEAELEIPLETPAWKANFLRKNAEFYTRHQALLDVWRSQHKIHEFPPSRRKLEWQAQSTPTLWECVMQLRPSGIRAKRPTHLPALVAITQTSIIGPQRRRLTPTEAARLQGLPKTFDFGTQPPAKSYKQLGNGVSVGAVWHVLKMHVERDVKILETTEPGRAILKAVRDDAPKSPDEVLEQVVARGQQRFADAKAARER